MVRLQLRQGLKAKSIGFIVSKAVRPYYIYMAPGAPGALGLLGLLGLQTKAGLKA